jgi:hypothetical protein
MQNSVFWDVTPCGVVEINRFSEERFVTNFKTEKLFDPEDIRKKKAEISTERSLIINQSR